MRMKLRVPNKNYGITELYDTVASLMGKCANAEYDCRHINVAQNIQDGFFVHYRKENQNIPHGDFQLGMAMLLLNYGPKVDENLADYEVEVFDGFIC
jgi:hypothetical protein